MLRRLPVSCLPFCGVDTTQPDPIPRRPSLLQVRCVNIGPPTVCQALCSQTQECRDQESLILATGGFLAIHSFSWYLLSASRHCAGTWGCRTKERKCLSFGVFISALEPVVSLNMSYSLTVFSLVYICVCVCVCTCPHGSTQPSRRDREEKAIFKCWEGP